MSTQVDRIRQPPEQARPVADRATLLAAILLVMGLGNWLFSLPFIDPDALGSLGLIGILPPGMVLAYGCIILGFCVSLSPMLVRTPWPGVMLVALILLLHLTPAWSYETLRYSWAWKHIGIIDYILRTGQLQPDSRFLSAYHNWPGFFVGFAWVAHVLDLDPLEIANLARFYPVLLNLALLVVVQSLMGRFTSDVRVKWLATALFLVGNWIGQDYFSPQGTVFLFYLIILSLLAGPLILRPADIGAHAEPASAPMARRHLIVPVVLALIIAIVISHQITPLFLLFSVGLLALLRRVSWGYVGFILMAELLWLFYFADDFVAPEFADLLAEFGRISDDTLGRIADLSVLSEGQRLVSISTRVLSGMLAGAAVIGVIRRLRAGHVDLAALLLMLAPAPVLLVNSYGGEVAFRLYLFALPFMAFFAAAALIPNGTTTLGVRRLALVGLALGVAVPLFILANNGKDAQYRFSPNQVAAADWLYSNSTPGQLLIEGARNYPSQFRNYENFIYLPLSEELPELAEELMRAPEALLARWLNENPLGGYIVLTKSHNAAFDDNGLLPFGAFDVIESRLLASEKFRIAFINEDALILKLNPAFVELEAQAEAM